MTTKTNILLGLDVGERRIGVARALLDVGLASPLATVDNDETCIAELQKLCTDERPRGIVVGLPRGLDGQHTKQTEYVEQFTEELQKYIDVPMYFQDEALTSKKAEEELTSRGKPYLKAEVDALAATYILEDFLQEHRGEMV